MKLLKRSKIVLPPMIVLAVYMIVLAIKKIYPFGNLTVDYYDMAQQISAFYYHIYDVLHGEKSLFLDPYTALSVNMAMSTSGCSHLSILNLFFLFIPRDRLLESLSFFLGLKMMLMSITMYIYIHNVRKLKTMYEVMLSAGYGFCGFVMILYVTIQWMDIAILFPLIMLSVHKLLRDGINIPYVILLTMALISSYYISFMILIYIVLMVGLEIAGRKIEKLSVGNKEKSDDVENEKNVVLEYTVDAKPLRLTVLLVETIISILLSAFIVVPQLKQTLMSARFNNENGGGLINMYMGIINTVKPAYTTRWFSLVLLSFSFAVIAYGLFRNRKNIAVVFYTVGSLFIVLAELFIESVNLIWHFGSYVQYPIRNGFIIYFTVSLAAAFFLEQEEIKLAGFSHIVIACVIAVTVLGLIIREYNRADSMPVRSVFHVFAFIFAVLFLFYLALITIGKGRFMGIMPVIFIAEMVLCGFIFIGHPKYTTGYSEEAEQEGEYIRICNQLSTAFNIKPDANYDYLLERIKNPDESLNANYGLCLRRPALSNWTHLLNPQLADDVAKLGYSVQFTRLLDAGGTAFSDALFSVNNVISYIPQDEELYDFISEANIEVDHIKKRRNNYYYYKAKNVLPFGVECFNADSIDFENNDAVEVYNEIYHSLAGNNKKTIAKWIYNNELQNRRYEERRGDKRRIKHSFSISGKQALYYFANQVDTDDYNTEIFVNGESVLIPSIKQWDNTLYPAHFNNNAVYLGTFENEDVDIRIEFADMFVNGEEIESEFSPNIMSIDVNLLENLCDNAGKNVARRADKSGYSFTVESEGKGDLFVPVSYDKGYVVTVNGKKQDYKSLSSIGLLVPLYEGKNNIRITFIPDGMVAGTIVSVVTLLLTIVLLGFVKKKNKKEFEIPFAENICFCGWVVIMLFMYFIPIIYGVVKCVV